MTINKEWRKAVSVMLTGSNVKSCFSGKTYKHVGGKWIAMDGSAVTLVEKQGFWKKA